MLLCFLCFFYSTHLGITYCHPQGVCMHIFLSLTFIALRQSNLGVSSTRDRCHTELTYKGIHVPLIQRDLIWPHVSEVEGSHSLTAFTRKDPNNCLQVKGPQFILFNCLHMEGPNNCLQVKGSHFAFHVPLLFICSGIYVYICLRALCTCFISYFQIFILA